MKNFKETLNELKTFIILWITQSFSALGSSMTSFALVIWAYQKNGSALETSLLTICSYLPYVVLSIFAGALSDKWNKKITMLASDSFAVFTTIIVFILIKMDYLEVWHLYLLNTLNGIMNTIQQPVSDVVISFLCPKEHYQKVSGMRSFSNSLVTLLTPVIATAVFTFINIDAVIYFDLITFAVAFFSLLLFIKIPSAENFNNLHKETIFQSAKSGLKYLSENKGILHLILFLAAINLTASMYNAALPAMMLSRTGGGQMALGIINTFTGVAMLIGSLLASLLPPPKNRVNVIYNSLLFAMSTENFILAFGRNLPTWCAGAILGWIFIPIMNANMDVIFRTNIPLEMQGRVYSARNTFQFFTIPLGYFLGGILVDKVFEPFMSMQSPESLWIMFFGNGKGSGAAMFFMIIGFIGVFTCLIFRKDKSIWKLNEKV